MIFVEYYLSLFTFTVVAGITPGPNNMMLLASATNHGMGRSIPLYTGICLGFTFMVAIVGFGVGAIFFEYPKLFLVVKISGIIYLLYLAWKTAHSGNPQVAKDIAAPVSFLQAAAFQWLNPKAWTIALGAFALFTVENRVVFSVASVIFAYFVSSFVCGAVWLGLGQGMRRLLHSPRRANCFNWVMAALLVLSVVPMALTRIEYPH